MDSFSGRGMRQSTPQREPVTVRPEPTTQREHIVEHPSRSTHHVQRRSKKSITIAVVGLVLALLGGWLIWRLVVHPAAPGIDTSKYQAVFLRDKYVYIGKLTDIGGGYYRITTVFYPESTEADGKTTPQLVPLGKDVLGAEDEMIIAKDQVIAYENLKADGQATKAIQDYLKSNK